MEKLKSHKSDQLRGSFRCALNLPSILLSSSREEGQGKTTAEEEEEAETRSFLFRFIVTILFRFNSTIADDLFP